jgi:hypothetical protein
MKKALLFFTLFLSFVSCRKDIPIFQDETPKTMEELKVPSGFDWKTTKQVELTLTGSSNGIVTVTSLNGTSYQKAFLSVNQAYTMKLTVPSYEKTVRLLFLGQQVTLELTGSSLSYNF